MNPAPAIPISQEPSLREPSAEPASLFTVVVAISPDLLSPTPRCRPATTLHLRHQPRKRARSRTAAQSDEQACRVAAMRIKHQVVVFDAADLETESRFWAGVLEGTVDAESD